MADKKEHHFCFSYQGERLRVTPFEKLHFESVQGTSLPDGTQLVRITLQKKNGRRAKTIPRIIDEYNALSGSDSKIQVPPEAIQIFKLNEAPSRIQIRIQNDSVSQSPRYWSWERTPAKEAQPGSKGAAKNGRAHFISLEKLVRDELNLDPSALDMQGAFDQISHAYFHVHGTQLKPAWTSEERAFISCELKRYFNKERMYMEAPFPGTSPTPAVQAIMKVRGRIYGTHRHSTSKAARIQETVRMDDLRFKASHPITRPTHNATAVDLLKHVTAGATGDIPVDVSFEAVLLHFNRESPGLYRKACIRHFMQPFIASGAVELVGDSHLRIHSARLNLP